MEFSGREYSSQIREMTKDRLGKVTRELIRKEGKKKTEHWVKYMVMRRSCVSDSPEQCRDQKEWIIQSPCWGPLSCHLCVYNGVTVLPQSDQVIMSS